MPQPAKFEPATLTLISEARRNAIATEARYEYRDHLEHRNQLNGRGVDACRECRVRRATGPDSTGVDILDLLTALQASEAELKRHMVDVPGYVAKVRDAVGKAPHETICKTNQGSIDCTCWKRRVVAVINDEP